MSSQMLIFIAAIWSLIVAIFWMVIGFRAMKAHENLAECHYELSRKVDKLANILKDQSPRQGD